MVIPSVNKEMYDKLKDWLIEHNDLVSPGLSPKTFNFLRNEVRIKVLEDALRATLVKARIALEWREYISNKLAITDDDVIAMTNTILAIMEKNIMMGSPIRIANFGDFILKTVNGAYITGFVMDENWKKEVNTPLNGDDIGLKYTMDVKKRKLTRKAEVIKPKKLEYPKLLARIAARKQRSMSTAQN
jgi:hypothetical protein